MRYYVEVTVAHHDGPPVEPSELDKAFIEVIAESVGITSAFALGPIEAPASVYRVQACSVVPVDAATAKTMRQVRIPAR